MTGGRTLSVTQIWLLLMALTLVSVLVGEGHLVGGVSGYAVVVLAAIKARLVVLDYMEARHAPGPWLLMFEGCLGAGALIMGVLVAAG